MPEDPYLFDGSIKENLLWANPKATESMMRNSLEYAHVGEAVEKLESGLDRDLETEAVDCQGVKGRGLLWQEQLL